MMTSKKIGEEGMRTSEEIARVLLDPGMTEEEAAALIQSLTGGGVSFPAATIEGLRQLLLEIYEQTHPDLEEEA